MSDFTIKRGSYGRPWITRDGRPLEWPEGHDRPLNGELYDRPSDVSGTLDTKEGLKVYHQAQAVFGAIKDKSLAWQFRALVSEFPDPWVSAKDEVKSLIRLAEKIGGEEHKAGIGTALHRLCHLRDIGADIIYPVAQVEPWLDVYHEAMTSRFEVLDDEVFVVCDDVDDPGGPGDLRLAGSFDRLLRDKVTGEVLVGDIKGLALTTELPTPGGWTTMGSVEVGDQLFGPDGIPCTVTAKSDIKQIGTFIVRFDDGSSVVCDSEHIWWTTTVRDRYMGIGPSARPIHEVLETMRYADKQNQHCVPVAKPLVLPEVDLPLDPYVLGVWLGDGKRSSGEVTKGDDLFEVLESDGHDLGVKTSVKDWCSTRTVLGLRTKLRESGLLCNKHLPGEYLRASIAQRTRLLQGLMDTDGTWNPARREAQFCSTDKVLALAVEELLRTLGQRPYLIAVQRSGFGKTVMSYDVRFTPVELNPFRLPRKRDQAAASEKSTTRPRRRCIVSIEPGPDVSTACVAVDSPSHVYLCGREMIPTHNTGKQDNDYAMSVTVQGAIYAHSQRYNQQTGERSVIHPDLNINTGALIHLPVNGGGNPECIIYPLDLDEGYRLAQMSMDITKARKIRVSKRNALSRAKIQ